MSFEITLTAKSTDAGGIVASFEEQLVKLGVNSMILVFETPPYRVDSSDSYWFEVKRTYTGSLSPTDPVEEDV